jgi:hypothetical protein
VAIKAPVGPPSRKIKMAIIRPPKPRTIVVTQVNAERGRRSNAAGAIGTIPGPGAPAGSIAGSVIF